MRLFTALLLYVMNFGIYTIDAYDDDAIDETKLRVVILYEMPSDETEHLMLPNFIVNLTNTIAGTNETELKQIKEIAVVGFGSKFHNDLLGETEYIKKYMDFAKPSYVTTKMPGFPDYYEKQRVEHQKEQRAFHNFTREALNEVAAMLQVRWRKSHYPSVIILISTGDANIANLTEKDRKYVTNKAIDVADEMKEDFKTKIYAIVPEYRSNLSLDANQALREEPLKKISSTGLFVRFPMKTGDDVEKSVNDARNTFLSLVVGVTTTTSTTTPTTTTTTTPVEQTLRFVVLYEIRSNLTAHLMVPSFIEGLTNTIANEMTSGRVKDVTVMEFGTSYGVQTSDDDLVDMMEDRRNYSYTKTYILFTAPSNVTADMEGFREFYFRNGTNEREERDFHNFTLNALRETQDMLPPKPHDEYTSITDVIILISAGDQNFMNLPEEEKEKLLNKTRERKADMENQGIKIFGIIPAYERGMESILESSMGPADLVKRMSSHGLYGGGYDMANAQEVQASVNHVMAKIHKVFFKESWMTPETDNGTKTYNTTEAFDTTTASRKPPPTFQPSVKPTVEYPSTTTEGTNTGGIVSGVIAAIVLLALIVGVAVYFVRKARRRAAPEEASEEGRVSGKSEGEPKPSEEPTTIEIEETQETEESAKAEGGKTEGGEPGGSEPGGGEEPAGGEPEASETAEPREEGADEIHARASVDALEAPLQTQPLSQGVSEPEAPSSTEGVVESEMGNDVQKAFRGANKSLREGSAKESDR